MYSKRLRELSLFAGLGKKDIEMVAGIADEVDIPAGKALAREGEFGREFFVIEEGTAEVVRDGQVVAELGPGDFFGEIALIEEERRTATVTARTPMTVVVLTAQSFQSLRHTTPKVYDTVRNQIASRRRAPAPTA